MGSRLPRTRRLWLWALAIGIGNTTLTQAGISVGTDRAGGAVAAVLLVVFADPGSIAHGSHLAIGVLLALLVALGWAAGGWRHAGVTQHEPDLDIAGITAAQFLAGGIPLIPLVLLDGGRPRGVSRRWSPSSSS